MSMDNVSNEKKMCKGYNFSFTKLNIFNSFYKHTFYDWGFCYGRRKEWETERARIESRAEAKSMENGPFAKALPVVSQNT